ncbi:BspA family leucine-rich repeat surface protein [Bifidobacterium sp. ESL0775]|nr:BspA family leucine-rich repeat surface protein [Bifidobacterium sp. ESL0775]WEV70029.1 BspA family leucine-rich repeat surface protein [Bifidobacterium sp. ESL0775]
MPNLEYVDTHDSLTFVNFSTTAGGDGTSAYRAFAGDSNLVSVSNVTNGGSYTFYGCTKLRFISIYGQEFAINVDDDSSYMFANCQDLHDLTLVSLGQNATGMFKNSGLNTLKLLNRSNSKYLTSLFQGDNGLQEVTLPGLVTSATTDISHMFDGCSLLSTADLSNWNLSGVTNAEGAFKNCARMGSMDLSSWTGVGKAKNMVDMFNGDAELATLKLPNGFVGAAATDTHSMFQNCPKLAALNTAEWDVSAVTNMANMFQGDAALATLDLSSWNTSGVTPLPANMASMLPSGLTALGLGASTRLDPAAFAEVPANLIWDQRTGLAAGASLVGLVGDTGALKTKASTNPAGYYVLASSGAKIIIDPGTGAATSTPSYIIDTSSSAQDFNPDEKILTNPAHRYFVGWKDSRDNSTIDGNASLHFNKGQYQPRKTVTLTAQWASFAPTIEDLKVKAPTVSAPPSSRAGAVDFEIKSHGTFGTSMVVRTGRGGSYTFYRKDSRWQVYDWPITNLVDPTAFGSTYSMTATTTITDPATDKQVTSDEGQLTGVLPWMTINFDKNGVPGNAPAPINTLVDTTGSYGPWSWVAPTLPGGRSGTMAPDQYTWLDSWTTGRRSWPPNKAANTENPLLTSYGSTDGTGHTTVTLTAQWKTMPAPSVYAGVEQLQAGSPVTVHIQADQAGSPDHSGTISMSTGLGGSCSHTSPPYTSGSTDTPYCEVTGLPIASLQSDPTPGGTYTITATGSFRNPDTGAMMTKQTVKTGVLPYMTARFTTGDGTGTPPNDTKGFVDTTAAESQQGALLDLPGRSGMTSPANKMFGGWTAAGNTYGTGSQKIPTADAADDGSGHYTITLDALWKSIGLKLKDITVRAIPGAAQTVSLTFITASDTPSGWTATARSGVGPIPIRCNSRLCRANNIAISRLVDPTPGSTYTVTMDVTATDPDTGATLTGSATATGILPYMTATFALDPGSTGTTPATIRQLVDTASTTAYLTLPPGTGLAGPSGDLFAAWASGERTWQPGAVAIPTSYGTSGGQSETTIAFTAKWGSVSIPTDLAAAYHHTGDTVTLTGKAMGTGGDTVKACMTDGTGGTDTCRTSAPNPRPGPEPAPGSEFTPVTTGNPRVNTFTVDPADVGSINITGRVDRDTTFTSPDGTAAHIRICPAGTPAPTAGDVPTDCSEITTNITDNVLPWTGANDNVAWTGRYYPAPKDTDHTTKDADFKNGDGYYDIWAYAAFRMSTDQIGTPVKIYNRYHYTATPPATPATPTAASWDWSVSFPASQYTSRYGADGQHHFTATQTNSRGGHSTAAELAGTLPWLKTTYDPNMPGGASATAPDPGKSLVDTSQASRPSDLTLARPTSSMEPPDAVFLGWSRTQSATAPDTGMGDPSNRTTTLSAPAGSPEADTTLHAVWRTLNQPAIDAASRDTATKNVTITGGATPWTSDETVEATATGLDGQTGSAVGTAQAPTLNTAGAYDGATRHGWTLTLPGTGIPQGGRYRVSASSVGDDGAWRGVAHRYAKATATQDVTIPAGATILHALPLTGGTARRLATLFALLLGATLLLLAAATKLRDKRREQGQGSSR